MRNLVVRYVNKLKSARRVATLPSRAEVSFLSFSDIA